MFFFHPFFAIFINATVAVFHVNSTVAIFLNHFCCTSKSTRGRDFWNSQLFAKQTAHFYAMTMVALVSPGLGSTTVKFHYREDGIVQRPVPERELDGLVERVTCVQPACDNRFISIT